MGILNDLRIALFDFRGYPKLLKKGKKHAIAFGVFLVTLFWIMTSVVPVVMFFVRTGGFSQIVETYVPEFTLQNGVLKTEQPLHYANGLMYVDVNTDPSNVVDPSDQKLRTILSLNDAVLVADSTKAVFKVTPVSGAGRSQMIEFSSLEGMTINKDYLRQLAPVMNMMECIMGVVFFFVHLAGFFFYSWVIAFTGRIFARFYRMDLPMSTVFPLAIYTRALPVLTEGVFFLAGMIFSEMAAIGMLYSIYALTRVFRYMASTGDYPGRTSEETGNRNAGYRRPREGSELVSEELRRKRAEELAEQEQQRREDRIPTPKTPDGGGSVPQQGGYAGGTADPAQQRPADGRIPTPKTPDGGGRWDGNAGRTSGGGFPGYAGPAADAGSYENTDAADAGSYDNTDAADAGSGNTGSGAPADAPAAEMKPAAAKPAEKKTPEEPGKPVFKPDHTEIREALVKEDLKPSDGWSFGTFAAAPAEAEVPEAGTVPGTEEEEKLPAADIPAEITETDDTAAPAEENVDSPDDGDQDD